MQLILSFLVLHFSALWNDGTYRISTSENSRVNGGSAVLVVESDKLRLRFVADRGQLMLDLQSPLGHEEEWFDAALLWRVLRSVAPESDLLDEQLADLVMSELERIEDMMRTEVLAESYSVLKRAQRQRSRDLFG